MRKRISSALVFAALVFLTALAPSPSAQLLNLQGWLNKLDPILQQRISLLNGQSRIIVRASDAGSLGSAISLIQQLGGSAGLTLPIITGTSATVPNASLALLARSPFIVHVSLDRAIVGAMERTGPTVGATSVREAL